MNHILSLLESMKKYKEHREAEEEPPSQSEHNPLTKKLAERNMNALEANWDTLYLTAVKKVKSTINPKSEAPQFIAQRSYALTLQFAEQLRQNPINDPTLNNIMNALNNYINHYQ